MTNEELNDRLAALADATETYSVPDLAPYGNVLPYIGWFWRDVDFAAPIRLGDCGAFIGFMENNKWDYPEWEMSDDQATAIRTAVADLATAPTTAKLQAFYDYLQTCEPPGGRAAYAQQWYTPEVGDGS